MNLVTASVAFSRYLPQRIKVGPIAEPSENTAAVVEVAVGWLPAEAGWLTLKCSLAPGTC